MAVGTVQSFAGTTDLELLRMAAAVENGSEHPIARAVVAKAPGQVRTADEFLEHAGYGVQGLVDGHIVVAGKASWLEQVWSIPITLPVQATVTAAESRGETAILVAWDGEAKGLLCVSDTVKLTSPEAIRRLRDLGLTPILLTGDNEGAARAVATEVGIDDVRSGATPASKLATIRQLQADGHVVAMVGDGVNDAAALAAADLGIAMGGGTDAAIAASDITVVSGDLVVVSDAIRLARKTLGTIKGNLFWAFAYNVAALPLAMLGLLNPLLAGAAMAFSSVFVVTNSLRLRRFQPGSATLSAAPLLLGSSQTSELPVP